MNHYKEKTDFPGSLVVQNPSANAEDMGLTLDQGRSHMQPSN